jgi:polysaccharide deacetylase family protein (PEP-CTERM system associated)
MYTVPARYPARAAEVRPYRSQEWSSKIILSFDVEEHYRIEAAVALNPDPALHGHCRERLDVSTNLLLDLLAEGQTRATFFVVGQVAQHNPALIRRMAHEGHEVASHSWDHRRVHHFNATSFREDVLRSKEVLENLTGRPVVGYRAPTFSIKSETAWALDVLVEAGITYDSSIYPVRHDRYGVPAAPRGPFLASGGRHSLLEFPPATLRLCGMNLPMGGGGYFRLFPLFLTKWAIAQTARDCEPSVATLYFHPWEFDPQQRRLPLAFASRLRTYVGIRRSRKRLATLLSNYRFTRAVDAAKQMDHLLPDLPRFAVGKQAKRSETRLTPPPSLVAQPPLTDPRPQAKAFDHWDKT